MKEQKNDSITGKPGKISNRHILAVKEYWTPLKVINFIRCEIEKKLKISKLGSMPYVATIDPVNACNLKCPGCPTGLGIEGRKKTLLDLKYVEKLLDQIGPYLFMANIYNWGEPLLHPQIDKIVSMIHKRNIFTSISTNLNIKDFDVIKRVCDAGLDYFIFSIDGVSPETYSRYRKGGDFNLVIENIRKLVEYRKLRKSKKPYIEWQMLTFKYLEHELKTAEALVEELGVDCFSHAGPTAPEHLQPEAKDLTGQFYGGSKFCTLLWHGIVLQSDGGIAPCCNLFYKDDDFGNINEASIKDIRSNKKYLLARNLFSPSKTKNLNPQIKHPCLKCPIIHRQEHLQEYLKANSNCKTRFDFMGILLNEEDYQKAWKDV